MLAPSRARRASRALVALHLTCLASELTLAAPAGVRDGERVAIEPAPVADETSAPATALHTLHVRSALTGEALTGVVLAPGAAPVDTRPRLHFLDLRGLRRHPHDVLGPGVERHPGPRAAAPILTGDSPLDTGAIPAAHTAGHAALWVSADGHAWGVVQPRFASDGELTVLLQPAAQLDVAWVSATPVVSAELSLAWTHPRGAIADDLLRVACADPTTRLSHVPAGRIDVTVRGRLADGSWVRTTRTITCEAGTSRDVTLVLDAAPLRTYRVLLPADGTMDDEALHLAVLSGGDDRTVVRSWPIGDLERTARADAFEFSTDAVFEPSGARFLAVLPSGRCVALPDDARGEVVLDLRNARSGAPAVDVAFVVRDARDGGRLEVAMLRVRRVADEHGVALAPTRDVAGAVAPDFDALRADGRWFRELEPLRPGRYVGTAGSAGYWAAPVAFDITADSRTIELTLERGAVLSLAFTGEGKHCMPTDEFLARLRVRDARGASLTDGVTFERAVLRHTFTLDADGPAHLDLPLLSDWLAEPDDLTVDLRRGATVHHVVRLRRR